MATMKTLKFPGSNNVYEMVDATARAGVASLQTAVGGLVDDMAEAVSFEQEQTLTDAQQEQARANIGAVSETDVADIKNIISLSQNITPKGSLTPNPKTINGVTITILGPGKLHLSGTATGDVAIDHYISNSALPSGMEYGESYYATVIGAANSVTKVYSYGTTFSELCTVHGTWGKFTAPQSGGLSIRTIVLNSRTYDETVEVVIIKNNVYTQSTTNFADLKSAASEVINLLTEIPSTTVNGLELTNIGNGQYTLTGTATADTNITFFTSTSEVPDYLKRGGKYCATLQGAKEARFIVTTRPGYTFLAKAKNYLAQFEVPSNGGMMIALSLDGGRTYNENITPIIVRDGYFPRLYLPKKTIVVSNDVADGDFGKIRDAVDYANQHKGTTIIIKEGAYNLVNEFGKSYLDGLSDSNPDYGIYLGNDVKIICSPRANIYFDYDGTNEWVVRYFSPFNTSNSSYEVAGMHITAHNCRYIVHDDPLWPDKTKFSHNVWRECYFEIFPSPQVASWVNHQIIGGGFGTNTLIEFDSCIFNAHYSGVDSYSSLSYHNDVSGWSGSRSFLTVKNCYFANGNRVIIQGYGSSVEKSKVIIAGNSFENATTDIVYLSSDADNIDVYQFNNQSR